MRSYFDQKNAELGTRRIALIGRVMAAALICGCLLDAIRDAAADLIVLPSVQERLVSAAAAGISDPARSNNFGESVLIAQNAKPASVRRGEPFHRSLVLKHEGSVWKKWQPVARAIGEQLDIVTACAQAPDKCSSGAALKFLSIMDEASKYEGRARLGNLNRAVNLAVKYTTDPRKHGIPDHWATPFDTLESGTGDCEDYAIAKYALLRALKWPASQLRIVLVWDGRSRDYHAVEATLLTRDWLILDNGTLVISAANKLPYYHPLFIIDDSSVQELTHPSGA
jgi:predicted transglutaminase-like cysteine proteinase